MAVQVHRKHASKIAVMARVVKVEKVYHRAMIVPRVTFSAQDYTHWITVTENSKVSHCVCCLPFSKDVIETTTSGCGGSGGSSSTKEASQCRQSAAVNADDDRRSHHHRGRFN